MYVFYQSRSGVRSKSRHALLHVQIERLDHPAIWESRRSPALSFAVAINGNETHVLVVSLLIAAINVDKTHVLAIVRSFPSALAVFRLGASSLSKSGNWRYLVTFRLRLGIDLESLGSSESHFLSLSLPSSPVSPSFDAIYL